MSTLIDKTLRLSILRNPIIASDARAKEHGKNAKNARERALIVYRMLIAELDWFSSRQLDDCFEMCDGKEVVACLLDMAEADPFLRNVLETHRSVGMKQLAEWERMRAPKAKQTDLFASD